MPTGFLEILWQLSSWLFCFTTLGCTIIHWRLGRKAGIYRDYALIMSSLVLVENITVVGVVLLYGHPCERTSLELVIRTMGRIAGAIGMAVWGLFLMGVLNGVHGPQHHRLT